MWTEMLNHQFNIDQAVKYEDVLVMLFHLDMDLLLEHLEVARWMEVLSRVVLAHGIFRRRRWIPPLFQMKDESAMLG